jgi:hypothetical protein
MGHCVGSIPNTGWGQVTNAEGGAGITAVNGIIITYMIFEANKI